LKEKMKAQVFYKPEDMRLEEVNIPQVAADEVLVEVKVCGICGSDIAYYWGLSPLETKQGRGPLILGHEFSGELVEMGETAKNRSEFKKGDRITIDPVQYCNTCKICAQGKVNLCPNATVLGVSTNGAFAEYVKCRYTNVYKLPSNVSYEEGTFAEPLSCAIYAIQKLEVSLGDICAILGPGPIGCMMVQLLKRTGAGKIIMVGTRDYRLRIAQKLGADEILNVKEKDSTWYVENLVDRIKSLTKGELADKVICATASQEAAQQALNISGRGSTVVFFGLSGPNDILKVPLLQNHLLDKNIRFSFRSPFTWNSTLKALSGIVDTHSLISHQLNLEELLKGMDTVRKRKEKVMKVLIKCNKRR